MELFQSIRLKIGKIIMLKKNSGINRKVFYSNISRVKTIGVVWDSSNSDQFPLLSKFYQKMHDRDIDIRVLGYFPGEVMPDQFTAVRYLTSIRKKDVNFFYIPVTDDANEFINYRFDILIDINFNKVFPLQYISSLSAARFKVGLYEAEEEYLPFELMMDIKKPVDISKLFNQCYKLS